MDAEAWWAQARADTERIAATGGDPVYDDDQCLDAEGEPWPEHDYDEIDCRRCGAEPEA